MRSQLERLDTDTLSGLKGVKTPIRRSSAESAVCPTASCSLTVDSGRCGSARMFGRGLGAVFRSYCV